ncbi:MAG: sigma-54-dependent transcriptional regulator [Candidatus Sumerlaeia bacterium]
MMSGQNPKGQILIVDDELAVCQTFCRILQSEGFSVEVSDNVEEACEKLASREIDIAFTDLRMKRASGVDVLHYIQRQNLTTLGVVITGYGTMDTAVEALRARAFDYILKPCQGSEIIELANRAMEHLAGRKSKSSGGSTSVSRRFSSKKPRKIIGKSQKMRELNELIERVASSSSTALIRGESGTGKELVARALHEKSKRSEGPLVPVNCGAIPEDLLESELFGHVRGAFTGAIAERPGRFLLAHRGTIFLDEIGDMSPKLQVKVLRVLQEHEMEPVGSTETLQVDTRVVAATNVDLERAVQEKRFREDLYYRLNVVPIEVPALRERKGDLPLLIKHFLKRFNARQERQIEAFATETIEILEAFPWPGNVRELENLVERMTILARTEIVQPDDLPLKFRQWAKSVHTAVSMARPAISSPSPTPEMSMPNPPQPDPMAFFQGPKPPSKLQPTEGLSPEEQSFIRSASEQDEAAMAQSFSGENNSEGGNGKHVIPALTDDGLDLSELVDDFERNMILQALEKCDGVKSRAAELLNIKRTTLVEKMKKKNIVYEK